MRDKMKQETVEPQRAGVPAIELRALCKAFGTLQALDHLTLEVEQGEIFGLLGPNGSGLCCTFRDGARSGIIQENDPLLSR
jgi:ABC-type uncharacterized transport system ATPase subunit